MKRFLLCMGLAMLFAGSSYGQLSITSLSTDFTIDFESTLSGVNNDEFAGLGFAPSPSAGELDSDAFRVTGLSDGDGEFGGTYTSSGDFRRGTDSSSPANGVTTGGIYGFEVLVGNFALGAQASGSDFNTGEITLSIVNNTNAFVHSVEVDYNVYILNDQNRASSFNFSYSEDDVSYSSVGALDIASTAAEDDPVSWAVTARNTTITGLTLAQGETLYLKWTSDDISGSGSRDEFALDDIVVNATGIPNLSVTGDAGWRLLSFPIDGGTVSDISDDTAVQGITDGDDATAEDNFFTYTSADAGSFGAPSNVSTAIGNGYGFGLYFFNNTTNGSSELPVTLDASGSEPSGNVTVDLYSGVANRFTLVGNPYASNYDVDNISAVGGSISDNIRFWDDGAGNPTAGDAGSTTGSYTTVDLSDGANDNYTISPWQGFWVETADAAVTQITFAEAGKTTNSTSATFFEKTATQKSADIKFSLSSGATYDGDIRLAFREYATFEFDRADASKLTPLVGVEEPFAIMGFLSGTYMKAVESLPYTFDEELTIPMEFTSVNISGEFTFAWGGLETIPAEWELTLHDYESGANVDMREVSEYVFEAEADAQAKTNPLSILTGPVVVSMKAKTTGDRFGITINPNTSVDNEMVTEPEVFALSQNYPNPFNPSTSINYSIDKTGPVTISVYNLMGQKVAELVNETKSAGSYNVQWNASNAASGMYYYRLEANGQAITRKMTLIK